MKCPTDNSDLVMSERNGIEIDYCPKCRGVWLDRGELDKIIERNAAAAPPAAAPAADPRAYHHGDDRRRYKKRESFLGELFDF